jgi:hypothetical protein
MATLYITEYAEVHIGRAGRIGQTTTEPPLVEQTVAISGASAQSAPFNAMTRQIRVHCDAICSVLVGINPTATTSSGRMVAGQTEYRGIPQSLNPFRIAVISNI